MTNKINVLLLDDSEIITSHIKKMLKEVDCIDTIESALNMKVAREILQKENIDILVLDIQLVEGNGIDFLKWVTYRYLHICVIMLSNNSDAVHRTISRK